MATSNNDAMTLDEDTDAVALRVMDIILDLMSDGEYHPGVVLMGAHVAIVALLSEAFSPETLANVCDRAAKLLRQGDIALGLALPFGSA